MVIIRGQSQPTGSTIFLFADGACAVNPGPGGWAVILRSGAREKELSGGYLKTTNNRMELRAVIEGLKALKKEGSNVTVVSDSQYVVSAVTEGWLEGWAKKGFRKSDGYRENADLWWELRPLLAKHRVTMEWIRGHAGHPENERCDQLAVQARLGTSLPVDLGYDDPAAVRVALGFGLL